MNEKTKIYYSLARMYEYAKDICTICESNHFNYESVIENMVTKHAVNMCFVQLGEIAARIRDVDGQFYRESGLSLPQIKGLRDRITHSYGDIDYKVIKNIMKYDIPTLKNALENLVHQDVLADPYLLYDVEYEEFLSSFVPHQKPPLTITINTAVSKVSEQIKPHVLPNNEPEPNR